MDTNRGTGPAAAAPAAAYTSERRSADRAQQGPADAGVRDEDLEPHEGLRYIARLFKVLAVILILMLIFEIVIALAQEGTNSIPTLVVETTRLVVLAAFLWGAGDLALMFIETNHDLRAQRILMGRMNSKLQRMVDIEADELELLAGNPSLVRERTGRGGSSGVPGEPMG